MRQAGRWICIAAMGAGVSLGAASAWAGDPDQPSRSAGSNAGAPDPIDAEEITLTHGEAAALAARLERVFGVGASTALWRDGLRTMGDLPAFSFDAVSDTILRVRAPKSELALVTAVARAFDIARADGSLVRIFAFRTPTQAEGASDAMQRLAAFDLMPGEGHERFDAPRSGTFLVALAPAVAHPMVERVAQDYGGALIDLAARSTKVQQLADRVAKTPEAAKPAPKAAPAVEVAQAVTPIERAPIAHASEPNPDDIVAIELAPVVSEPAGVVAIDAPSSASAPEAQVEDVEALGAMDLIALADPAPLAQPVIALPDAPVPESEVLVSSQEIEKSVPVLPVPFGAAPVVVPDRVVRVVVLEAADANVIGPRMQQVARAAFDDVQIISAGAGNALLVVGAAPEADACVAIARDVDAAAARLTEDAMLVMLDGNGALDIARQVQRLVRRPGGELGVRIASDEARGAIALTGPRDAATLVGGLAEALGHIELVPEAATAHTPPADDVGSPHVTNETEMQVAPRPTPTRTGRDVVVRAIRPEGDLRQTAEFVRLLLERAGVSPVRVTELSPGQTIIDAPKQPIARRKLLVPKRIRMIIKYSQTTLARFFDRDASAKPTALDQVFATMERTVGGDDPRLEVVVLPDRQALALVGDTDAVAKGAELATALGEATGLDRIEVAPMQFADAGLVANMLEKVLATDKGAGGQLRVSHEPRLNMVVITGPQGAAQRAAALARSMDSEHPWRSMSMQTGRTQTRTYPSQPLVTPEEMAPVVREAAPAVSNPTHSTPVRQLDITARVFAVDTAQAMPWTHHAPVAVASREFEMLIDGLIARGCAWEIDEHVLSRSSDGRVVDALSAHTYGVSLVGEARDNQRVRLTMTGQLRDGDRHTLDVSNGELVILTGAVRTTDRGEFVDLALAPMGKRLGLVVVRARWR